eukprot:CAMPEP_0196183536 /NCGR_PEP_ID=MMETSP0911-20130528/31930_1 /TAXON_ID=49265 /ORGANISM="Thalassiosira rotula, Strain GSO102" /LENGTH=101 /DNA_ID=CAMNT_0041453485 /DNA_START=661 /DNA_END=966 /DNA_ORIENTATION=+
MAPTLAIASALVSPTLNIDAASVASAGTTASIPAMRNGMATVVPTAMEVPRANVFIFAEDTARGRMGSTRQTSRPSSEGEEETVVQSLGFTSSAVYARNSP